jgi:hypothetical protein
VGGVGGVWGVWGVWEVWGHSLRSTFHRLHLLRLWTPTILLLLWTNAELSTSNITEGDTCTI